MAWETHYYFSEWFWPLNYYFFSGHVHLRKRVVTLVDNCLASWKLVCPSLRDWCNALKGTYQPFLTTLKVCLSLPVFESLPESEVGIFPGINQGLLQPVVSLACNMGPFLQPTEAHAWQVRAQGSDMDVSEGDACRSLRTGLCKRSSWKASLDWCKFKLFYQLVSLYACVQGHMYMLF